MSKSIKLLDDVLYAFCMYFAAEIQSLLPQNTLTLFFLFLIIVLQLSIESAFSHYMKNKTESLWSDIIFVCIYTCSRICSFLLVSFFISISTSRWEKHHERLWGESFIVPILVVFVGISLGKAVAVKNKFRNV